MPYANHAGSQRARQVARPISHTTTVIEIQTVFCIEPAPARRA
jgi:hypothetical protein